LLTRNEFAAVAALKPASLRCGLPVNRRPSDFQEWG
jgi:hypothetical protein